MIEISTPLVHKLIHSQFPKWKDLEISPVKESGHDNKTFHLGKEMMIRLPSDAPYVAQIEKEFKWLPFLAKRISLPITLPIALGAPTADYPFPWSVNRFIEGESLYQNPISNKEDLAKEIAAFLNELQKVDAREGPLAGKHNFYRGASPVVYYREVEKALQSLEKTLPATLLKEIWNQAILSKWAHSPVWIHGDIAPGNLLVKEEKLRGVIDFGMMAVGDPACDYAMAWTFFDEASRKVFLKGLDASTIHRARGWALWKALITYHEPNFFVAQNAKTTIQSIVKEYSSIL